MIRKWIVAAYTWTQHSCIESISLPFKQRASGSTEFSDPLSPSPTHQTPHILASEQHQTSTMHFLYTLLPLLPLAAANGRVHFNAFGEPSCSGFEETYSLNPAPVKGNFPGKGLIKRLLSDDMFLTNIQRTSRIHSDTGNVGRMSSHALHRRQPVAEWWHETCHPYWHCGMLVGREWIRPVP
jgi:hypothetical protein